MIDLSEIYHIVCCISGTVLVTEFFMADAKLVFIKINNRLIRSVKVGLDLEKIAIEGFLALTCLLGPSDEHIKSLQLLDTWKVVNLHKFKMAAAQSFNLHITFFWLLLDPINVLQTTFFGFNLFIY